MKQIGEEEMKHSCMESAVMKNSHDGLRSDLWIVLSGDRETDRCYGIILHEFVNRQYFKQLKDYFNKISHFLVYFCK